MFHNSKVDSVRGSKYFKLFFKESQRFKFVSFPKFGPMLRNSLLSCAGDSAAAADGAADGDESALRGDIAGRYIDIVGEWAAG